MQLDIDFVRRQFPAFQDEETARWAMFENAGGSYLPEQVIQRLDHYHRRHRVQPYGAYGPSQEAGKAMDRGYAAIAGLINADVDDVRTGAQQPVAERRVEPRRAQTAVAADRDFAESALRVERA